MRTEEDIIRINISEISVLIIENNAVSITGCLLSELCEKKVKVVFCDGKRNPQSELVSYYGSHDSSEKIRTQIKWSDDIKGYVWTEIVAEKIRKQSQLLYEIDKPKEAHMLEDYIQEIEFNDNSNREGHAAKVYFNALFGLDFTRSAECVTNHALNYGYSILLSAFNRECSINGYLTQLGLFHNNMFNYFNLACDLMEPFRVLVDRDVKENNYTIFDTEVKRKLVNILNQTVMINGNEQYVTNAIKLYCKSVFDAINDKDVSQIKFYSVLNNS